MLLTLCLFFLHSYFTDQDVQTKFDSLQQSIFSDLAERQARLPANTPIGSVTAGQFTRPDLLEISAVLAATSTLVHFIPKREQESWLYYARNAEIIRLTRSLTSLISVEDINPYTGETENKKKLIGHLGMAGRILGASGATEDRLDDIRSWVTCVGIIENKMIAKAMLPQENLPYMALLFAYGRGKIDFDTMPHLIWELGINLDCRTSDIQNASLYYSKNLWPSPNAIMTSDGPLFTWSSFMSSIVQPTLNTIDPQLMTGDIHIHQDMKIIWELVLNTKWTRKATEEEEIADIKEKTEKFMKPWFGLLYKYLPEVAEARLEDFYREFQTLTDNIRPVMLAQFAQLEEKISPEEQKEYITDETNKALAMLTFYRRLATEVKNDTAQPL